MSGHSKWATIKRAKGANDAKRGAVFTKIGNQIAIAARNGADPTMNAALAMMIEKAKAVNMPNANIQRAIDRVSDKNAAVLEEVTYEAYGPGGVGIIVEAATDNKNRTLPEVKNALTKNGGRIAEPGSVAFQFEHKGVLRIKAEGEDSLLAVLEAGADDAIEEDGGMMVVTDPKKLAQVRENLQRAGMTVFEAGLEYLPKSTIDLSDAEAERKLLNLFDVLDELDGVVNVSSNAHFAD
jgi:YebC/PmpR family DNA-binding regulatory protein